MTGYSKKVKAQFRKLVDEAYERELARELAQLAARFDEWRVGRISASELSHWIHQFDKGPAHETYSLYNLMDQEFVVARAVAESLLSEDEIPAEVWSHIHKMVQHLRDYRNDKQEQ
jgi:hypothetical protein